ncbi:MAG: DUF616 domain-containing protein [Bacteroides sp.]|nr:DUF616 domain-containing protein [Bacteroides sp.]
MKKNKKVIYTSLTGGYDSLPQYEVIDPDFDYICFSNDYPENTKIGQWIIKSIPLDHSNPIHLSRYAKLLPHQVLQEYDWSVWLDANLILTDKQIYNAINSCIEKGSLWYGIKHPHFNCIYTDAIACIKFGKGSFLEIKKNIDFLKRNQYPKERGLFENNFIIRKHNSDLIRKIDEEWWKIFTQFAPRDQLSLFFLFWKYNFKPNLIFDEKNNTHNSNFVRFINHPAPTLLGRIKRRIKIDFNCALLSLYSNIIKEK